MDWTTKKSAPASSRDLSETLRTLRDRGNGAGHLRFFDLTDTLGDQLFVDRLDVELLHKLRRLFRRRSGDLVQDRPVIVVAGVDSLEVQHRETAELPHRDREFRVHNAIHGGGKKRYGERPVPERQADLDFLGIDRHIPGNKGDLIKTIGAAGLAVTTDKNGHELLSSAGRRPE